MIWPAAHPAIAPMISQTMIDSTMASSLEISRLPWQRIISYQASRVILQTRVKRS
jgi:hypothetical protein